MLAAGGGRTLSVAFHMKTDDAVGALLRTAPYFSGLSGDVLTIVARRCQSKTFRAGQVVFMEGDPCRHLHILESGRVKFFRTSAEGREQILKVFERPGDTFCIPSAFVGSSRAVNVLHRSQRSGPPAP